MASTKEYLDYVLCQINGIEITYKKMIGEYLMYANGVLFGGLSAEYPQLFDCFFYRIDGLFAFQTFGKSTLKDQIKFILRLLPLNLNKSTDVCWLNAAAIYYDDNEGLSDTFDEIFSVNVKSNEVLIEYALTLNKKVNVVLISGSSSTRGRANLTNYSAAKAALNSIVESQAERLCERNVYLNAVIPEKVNMPLIAKLHKTEINLRELLEPKEVINAIMYLASSSEHGQLIHIRKGL